MTQFVPLSQYTDSNLRSGKCVEKFGRNLLKNFYCRLPIIVCGRDHFLHWALPKNFADYFAALVLHIFRLFLS